ncbi:MAG: hypothetical protein ABI609_18085, partial [Acidobacteriota bacterium]
RNISRLVLGESLQMMAVGLGLGIAAALAVGRFMQSLLYEVQPTDLRVLGGVTLALLTTALIAALLPARRARKIDPATALSE